MSKTVIVTGGCGYIGSHIARAFKMDDPDNRVHIIDNVYREHTVKGIDGHLINDFASKAALSMLVMLEPDIIVHCAGTSLVGPSMDNPAEYYDNNVTKTLKMLDVIKDMPKKPVILFSSSASVYGEPDHVPIVEDSRVQPMSPYGSTKATVELMLKDYASAYKINSMCFRYFNAAGAEPLLHDLGQEIGATHIIARVLEASIANRAFTINGTECNTLDGTCVRDYVHVQDIAIAHLRGAAFMERLSNMSSSQFHVFNLGQGTGVSNKEIVDYVVEQYGLPFVNYGPSRPGDPDILVADTSKASNLLGWTPQYTIKDIINDAYKWYTRK